MLRIKYAVSLLEHGIGSVKNVAFLSVYGVSILGAAAHNIGQILAAMVLMNSVYIGMYLAYLLIVALFTGFATGAACAGVLRILSMRKTT